MDSGTPMMKSALVAAVLLAVIQFGSADKLANCCQSVGNSRIREPIIAYTIQHLQAPCVLAVIMQTETELYCVNPYAWWVRNKLAAFEKAKKKAATAVPSSTVSLLSIITATASPASPSATSFPSTSQTPADDIFEENNSE